MLLFMVSLLLAASAQLFAAASHAHLHVEARATTAISGSKCKTLTVATDDTCPSIARKSKVSFAQLISWNSHLNMDCSNLDSFYGKDICVSNPNGDYSLPTNTKGTTTTASTAAPIPTKVPNDTNKNCGEYARVEDGVDCSVLINESGISREDFLFLNPQLFENCTNLWYDYAYCIKPVGVISTYPGYGGAPTRPPFDETPSTKVPYNETRPNPGTNHTINPIPLANGTRRDCYEYLVLNNVTDNGAADCWEMARFYGASREDFILWNPSLAESTDSLNALCGCVGSEGTPVAPGSMNLKALANNVALMATSTSVDYYYPCTASSSLSYCVQLSRPTQTPEIPVPSPPPSPRAAGEITNCTYWVAPVAGEGLDCETLILRYDITFDDFYKMNPSVGSDCSKMSLGTYYCLSTYPYGDPRGIAGEDNSTTTISAKPTTTSLAPGTTPTPIQSGMTKSCNKFYYVVKGDVCGDIAKKYGISTADFLKWNPAVKSDCTELVAENYVCVNVL